MTGESQIERAVIFGGSGFLGRAVVVRLAAAGITPRIAVRHPESLPPAPGCVDAFATETVYADVRDETSVAAAVAGCDAIVNTVGLYVETGAETFESVHELGAHNVAHQAAQQGIDRLVHISGIGAKLDSPSTYVCARAKGELLVRDAFPNAVILRPSALFAPDDHFINGLADMLSRLPLFPLFGDGATRLQPVHRDDVAQAVVAALTRSDARGKVYELGGAEIMSYRALIERIAGESGRRPWLLPLPFALWELLAVLAALLPRPPLTKAQVALMKSDNVVAPGALGFRDLEITPDGLQEHLPQYSL